MSIESKATSPKSSIASITKFPGVKVLVVEDSLIIQKTTVRHLENRGIVCKVVNNGLEALEEVSSSATAQYDLILMDIEMPKMDGCQATRKIRELPAWKNLPIIAFSAKEDLDATKEALNAGMNDFVFKSKSEAARLLEQAIAKYLPGKAVKETGGSVAQITNALRRSSHKARKDSTDATNTEISSPTATTLSSPALHPNPAFPVPPLPIEVVSEKSPVITPNYPTYVPAFFLDPPSPNTAALIASVKEMDALSSLSASLVTPV